MTRPLAAVAVALALAGYFAGCGSDSTPPAEAPATPPATQPRPQGSADASTGATGRLSGAGTAVDEAAIGALIQARADALSSGRAAAYARTATGDRRRRDGADARRARRLGVRGVRISSLGIRVRDSHARASIRVSYRLAGVAGRWEYSQGLRLRRTRSGWRVTGLRPRGPRPPWELGEYRRSRTPHFTVFAPGGLDPDAAGLDATLERAYATIHRRLPGRGQRRYSVLIAADLADMAAMTRGIRDVGRLSAITDLAVRTSGPAERVTAVLGARILIPWPSFLALSVEARERVLTHELAHAVLAPVTSGRAPAWLQEGIALYVSGDSRTDAARAFLTGARPPAAARLGALARPDAMAALAGDDLSAAYAFSSSTAYHVAGRFGPRKLLELLAAFGDESLPGRAGRSLSDRATRRVLGISQRRLEADVAGWLLDGAPALGG